jgi:hypothetical protein
MVEKRGFSVDRRTGHDRRKGYNPDYFLGGGLERRNPLERRYALERRLGWIRLSKWNSINQRSIAGPMNLT